ncbi:hypothetical protein [Breznakiella homolactica]|uniref:Nitroreductase n=1 Tax=Breznakiella homolactica TaxID=2798577 RepID=A0A7T8BC98_9SPIR|nr:hypothetical protein [Breznakiella homolactica]QQO10023.1 hypothetical protein JFL75_03665 [Breznakiella homolactica]
MRRFGVFIAAAVLVFSIPGCTAKSTGQAGTSGMDIPRWILSTEDTILTFDANSTQPTKNEIETMLKAAMKPENGSSTQKYWYTVVTDYNEQMKLATTPQIKPTRGTVLLIISVPQNGSTVDMGISYGYFSLAAKAMGYGTHMFGQPARALAAADFSRFSIPEGYVPMELVLVGKSDTVDAKSAASSGKRENKWNWY